MDIIAIVFAGILGTIIGSFLNVVILRYGTGKSVGGRSGCMSCGHQLRSIDMVPILSWVVLRGKCRKCRCKISAQYPLVELATGLVFAILFKYSLGYTVITSVASAVFVWNAIIFSLLIVIFAYDWRHKIIPDGLVFTFIGMSLAQTIYHLPNNFWSDTISILNLLIGPIFFFIFYLVWKFSDGRLIGYGDLKLMLGLGWFFGFVHGLSSLVLAFWAGALYAIAIMLISRLKGFSKNITMKTEIPFGPFLILGIFIEFFWAFDVLGLNFFF